MGFMDKIKDALFEEVEEEVEEKPIKPKKEKVKKEKESIREKLLRERKKKEEKPVAKKVILPEDDERVSDKPLVDEDFDLPRAEEDTNNNTNEFYSIDESDLVVDSYPSRMDKYEDYKEVEKEEVKKEEPVKEDFNYFEEKKEEKLYSGSLYGDDLSYERKVVEDRKIFRPSPIISPVYGVLDKNYRKEEIVDKNKEERVRKKRSDSLDDIRNKAYGTLSEEDVDNIDRELRQTESDKEVVDLSKDGNKPEVNEVTVGDAEEYFNDLGLEYNVDYVDSSTDKASNVEERKEKEVDVEVNDSLKEDVKDEEDDNLFDLIDSMYEEKE